MKVNAGVAAMRSIRGARPRGVYDYMGIRFRSSWEVIFARWLDRLCVQWLYEPDTYELPDGRKYTPDFKIRTPFGDWLIAEVKGIRKFGSEKFDTFRAANPGLEAILVVDQDIERIRRILGAA